MITTDGLPGRQSDEGRNRRPKWLDPVEHAWRQLNRTPFPTMLSSRWDDGVRRKQSYE